MKLSRLLALALIAIPSVALAAKPAWVDGKDPKYSDKEYLSAVGFAPDRTAAENGAMANLSKIFEASVKSVSKDYMGAFSNGKQALEVQSVETLNEVSTKKVLSGVKIAETWNDTSKSTMYALAVLERGPAAATLREKIGELDKKISANVTKARETEDKVKKLKSLRTAAKDLQERMVLNADLRIIAVDGQGVTAEFSAADIANEMEGAADEFNIGVQVSGASSSDLSQALIDGLTQAGFQVKLMESSDDEDDEDEDSGDSGGDFDLLVRAKSRMENATTAETGPKFARVVVDVEIYNPAKKKVITTINESKKEGHASIEEAARRAVRSMKAALCKKIGDAIQKQMGPK